MSEKSTGKERKSDFKTLIPEYSDEEILDILKKRNYYQPEAADLAIKEAIKRELIYSEQDLVAEKFRVKPMRYSLFPSIEKENQKERIRKSIARVLFIAGVLPTVWGFVRFFGSVKLEGSILISFGFLWIFLSSRLFRKAEPLTVRGLFILLALSVIYIVKILNGPGSIVFMDVFILIFIYALVIYGLVFLMKIGR